MSQLESYLNSILEHARKEADSLLMEARKEADRIINNAKNEALEIAKRRAREYIETQKNRLIDESIRERIKEKALMKESIMKRLEERVIAKLNEKITSRDFDYPQFLFKILLKAILVLGADKIIVHANARDMEFLKSNVETFKKRIQERIGRMVDILFGEPIETSGGLIISTGDGSKSFNATLEGLATYFLKKKTPIIVRRLGLVSQKHFKRLVSKIFENIKNPITIKDSLGRDLQIYPCDRVDSHLGDDARADIICVGGEKTLIALVTLGILDNEKLRLLLNAPMKLGVNNYVLLAITFAGISENINSSNLGNIYVITRKELADLDEKLQTNLFS